MVQSIQTKKPTQKYLSLTDLAQMTGEKHNAIYHFIRQYNRKHAQPIGTFHLPTKGLNIYVKEEDAEMICALFAHPEDYAEPAELK